MELLPINLTELVAIVLGMSIVLIPIAGLTARFALKPLVDSLSQVNASRGVEEAVTLGERRIALLEQQVEMMETAVRDLEAARDFHRALEGGDPPP